ncbi:hypothetical protein F5Y17DRAFT_454193 [Xylariaceae sp. FL0594]|nr:hypothetical protein F5Y17DRAFT_454193 [Xylariaceae sp. FL0594]
MKRIEDYGLVREEVPTGCGYDASRDVAFLDPYFILAEREPVTIPFRPEWRTFRIIQPQTNINATGEEMEMSMSSPRLLNVYAVSPSHGAYVTLCVKLTSSPSSSSSSTSTLGEEYRYTPMRYRDMIADNLNNSNLLSALQLRWIAVSQVMNPFARETFFEVFTREGKDILLRGRVEIEVDCFPNTSSHHTPPSSSSSSFHNNNNFDFLTKKDPFCAGIFSFLRTTHYAKDRNLYVKRFIFLSDGYDANNNTPLTPAPTPSPTPTPPPNTPRPSAYSTPISGSSPPEMRPGESGESESEGEKEELLIPIPPPRAEQSKSALHMHTHRDLMTMHLRLDLVVELGSLKA